MFIKIFEVNYNIGYGKNIDIVPKTRKLGFNIRFC